MRSNTQLCALFILVMASIHCRASELLFDVRLERDFSRYRDLFETPSALIVVLENSGFTFSHAGRIRIRTPRIFELERNKSIPFKKATVRFWGRLGNRYRYTVSVDWSVGLIGKTLDIQSEIDTTELGNGKSTLSINLPGAFFMPDVLKGYVQEKILGLANVKVQLAVLQYLQSADERIKREGGNRLEWFLADAYNLPRTVLEEPVTFERFLIGSILLWMGILPLALTILLTVGFVIRPRTA